MHEMDHVCLCVLRDRGNVKREKAYYRTSYLQDSDSVEVETSSTSPPTPPTPPHPLLPPLLTSSSPSLANL